MERNIFSKIFETTYTIVNHDFVKKFDLVTAYWLCELMSWMQYLRKKNKINEDEWFYYDQSHIEKKIGISSQRQNRIIKKLKSIGIMDVKRKGVPPRNYYQINYEKLAVFVYGESFKSIKMIDLKLSKQGLYYNSKKKGPNFKNEVGEPSLNSLRKENIRPSFYRFSHQVQKVQIQNHPSQFRQHSPKQLEKQVASGAETLDKLVRLDHWDFEKEIKPAIKWGVAHEFWSRNILSLAQLRNKKNNSNTKFTNLFNQWQDSQKKKTKKKPEDWKNPSRPTLKKGPDGAMHWVQSYDG